MLQQLKQSLSVWLIKKIQTYGPHKVCVLGKTYEVSQDVFNPKFYFTSRFMAGHINIRKGDAVLDMGTGSGIQAITAGQMTSHVTAVDINPEAVRYARKNVRANGLENIVTVVEGDLFAPLSRRHKFDVILFTPPYMEGDVKKGIDHALFDPGNELLKRFFLEAKEFVAPGGYVQMLYSSVADPARALDIARDLGWRYELIAREKTFSEIFLIYKLSFH